MPITAFKIIIGGGTGLVGCELVPSLIQAGHAVTVVGRDKHKIQKKFSNSVKAITWDELDTCDPDNVDMIINLSGENIAGHRWTEAVKNILVTSRVQSTRRFVNWCHLAKHKKPHLYNASAVGIYGLQTTLPIDTSAFDESYQSNSNDFASQLVKQWEQAALSASDDNIPVTVMRFAVVLKHGEGMLKKLELPTQIGLGTVVGTGLQPISWIDSDDLVAAILFLLNHPDIIGPINLVAPEVVTQQTFMTTLAQVLNRPLFLRLPAWFVKLAFGQMGEELLLAGQAASPQRLLGYGFKFKYPSLLTALQKTRV